jgi:hypothetical protein
VWRLPYDFFIERHCAQRYCPNGQYPALNLKCFSPLLRPLSLDHARCPERLYALLPAIYRLRDAAQGEQLRALLAIIESELRSIRGDMEALYENWFIETCEDWVVPYIGDLLAVRDLNSAARAPLVRNAAPMSPIRCFTVSVKARLRF